MFEELGLTAHDRTVVAESRWVKGISGEMAVGQVAHRVLDARLSAISHWLPLAALNSEENIEYVHQLRTATRRAMQGVRVFSGLLPDGADDELRSQLRRIRMAADAARNWDVLRLWFPKDDQLQGVGAELVAWIQRQRQDSQPQVVAIHEELQRTGLTNQWAGLAKGILTRTGRKARGKFERQAGVYLRPVVKRFFRAAASDLAGDEAVHELRIRVKKLRYTMEIIAPAFDAAFREQLYPQVNRLQDWLGCINDHATARRLLRGWSAGALQPQQHAFLGGLLIAEARAHRDLRGVFLANWTPGTLSDLRRRFRRYCHSE